MQERLFSVFTLTYNGIGVIVIRLHNIGDTWRSIIPSRLVIQCNFCFRTHVLLLLIPVSLSVHTSILFIYIYPLMPKINILFSASWSTVLHERDTRFVISEWIWNKLSKIRQYFKGKRFSFNLIYPDYILRDKYYYSIKYLMTMYT